jgi:hypothetical protein
MADKPMKLRDLTRTVTRFGGWEDSARGKGSHTMFFRRIEGGVFSYPIPTHSKEVKKSYVKGLRERLRLTAADGVSDEAFYQ